MNKHRPGNFFERAILLLAFLSLLPPQGVVNSAAPWGTNYVVAKTTSTVEEHPRMAAGPNGAMTAVYSLDYDVYAATRSPGSSAWNSPVIITDPARQMAIRPDVAVGSNGTIYTVWTDKRSGFNNDIYFSRSTDGGATWSANVDIIPPVNHDPNQVEPAIALDPRLGNNNVIYVASLENPASGQMFIDFSRSTDGGSTWTFQRLTYPVGPTIYKIGSQALAVDAQGRIYLIFDELDTLDTRSFFTTSNDGGQTWKEMIPLTPPFDGCLVAHHPALDLGNTGVIYVAYVETYHTGCNHDDKAGVHIKVIRSANEGQNWENPILAVFAWPKDILQNVGLAVLPNGFGVTDDEIVIAWSDSPAKFQLYSVGSKNGGASWGDPVKISDAAGSENINADFPQLLIADGIVQAIWRDARRNSSVRVPYTAAMLPSLDHTLYLPMVVK